MTGQTMNRLFICLLGLFASLWVCEVGGAATPDQSEQHPHALLRVTETLYSGAEPEGEADFKALAELGVKVVLSVDGIRPDLETASQFGLRYIHIPMSYGGISDKVRGTLERVAGEITEPVYIHCHHGKHRGPAAAAMLAMVSGVLDRDGGLSVLRQAGTSERYEGLWRSVRVFEAWPKDNRPLPPLVEAVASSNPASIMARIDRVFDDLEEATASGWGTMLDPKKASITEGAVLLGDGFRETIRAMKSNQSNAEGEAQAEQIRLLGEAAALAYELESAAESNVWSTAEAHFNRLDKRCGSCHRQYRD